MEIFAFMSSMLANLIVTILALLISSSVLLVSFVVAKQNWIKSRQLAATMLLLPIITYGITTVISGNISLSLGLVGALSIVRFRNPVKSPLELTAMFAAISFGIMATQSVAWPMFISVSLSGVILLIHFADLGFKVYFDKNLLSYSFAEAGSQYSIELKGFNEGLIEEFLTITKDLAISSTICQGEKESHCFISSESKKTIELLYSVSKGRAEKRTLNVGI
jgi:hypothetical protein